MPRRPTYAGIEARVNRKGHTVYYGRLTVNGRRTWRKLHAVSAPEAANERELMQAKLDRAAYGGYDPPLDTYVDQYIEAVKGRLSRPEDKRSKLHNLIEHFGGRRMSTIKPSELEAWVGLRARQVAPATVNRELATLKALYNFAIRDDMLEANPVMKVAHLPEPPPRDRILTEDEWAAILDTLAEPVRGMAICAYHTGMRRGEILPLMARNVAPDAPVPHLRIVGQSTSTKVHERIVPLWEPLLSDIAGRLDSMYLYPSPKTGKPYTEIKTAWRGALRRAGIENFRWHDLRHCAITNMRRRGLTERVIMAITGHKSLQIHYRYSNVTLDDLAAALKP